MEVMRIPTENPKTDQWKLLAQFVYPTGIRRYMEKQGITDTDSETVEFIAGCIRQAEAYFVAGENSLLDIVPLLLYYGTANLLAGVSGLVTGKRPTITSHGMRLRLRLPMADKARIADIQVLPEHPRSGALQQFSNIFSDRCLLAKGTSWTVEEILGSIPDLKREFENCYPDALLYTIPIEIIRRSRASLERIVPSDLSRYQDPLDALSRVEGFSSTYLPPQYGNQMDYIVIYRRMGVADIGTYSIFGHKHLQMAHIKEGLHISPNQVILIYMGLFALGYLSRYHPEIWNPFIMSDETGEKLVIEKFLTICHRYLPNLILNVVYGTRIQFVYETEGIIDQSSSLSESDLREMLRNIDHDTRGTR